MTLNCFVFRRNDFNAMLISLNDCKLFSIYINVRESLCGVCANFHCLKVNTLGSILFEFIANDK